MKEVDNIIRHERRDYVIMRACELLDLSYSEINYAPPALDNLTLLKLHSDLFFHYAFEVYKRLAVGYDLMMARWTLPRHLQYVQAGYDEYAQKKINKCPKNRVKRLKRSSLVAHMHRVKSKVVQMKDAVINPINDVVQSAVS